MGKAVLDLPDPLEQATPDRGEAPPSVDDLLAQMAGEEIDRLLTEVEHPRQGASETPAESSALPPKVAAASDLNAQPGAAGAALDPALVTGTAFLPSDPQAIVSKEKFVPTMPTVADGVRIAAETDEEQVQTAVPVESPAAGLPTLDEEVATTSAERSALELALGDPEAPAPQPVTLEFPEVDPKSDPRPDASLPFYLKPLEWLNAPLDACPEAVRGVIGKIALLTLFNTAAVLIYVLVFRKHR